MGTCRGCRVFCLVPPQWDWNDLRLLCFLARVISTSRLHLGFSETQRVDDVSFPALFLRVKKQLVNTQKDDHHFPFKLPLLGFDFPTILPLPCVPVAHGAPVRRMACCRHSEDRAEEEGGRLSWWKRLGKITGKFGPLGAFLENL